MSLTKSLAIGVVVGGMLACCSPSGAADEATPGKAVNGLRIELQMAVAKKGEKSPPLCEAVLENVGDVDLNLMLGYSLANGKSHHPGELKLIVTAPGEKPRTLIYAGGRVAGRVDPLVVPLPVGSRYTLRLTERQFADEATGDSINLSTKGCRIVAEFTGKSIEEEGVNGDMEGLALISCWKGTVRSNEFAVLPAKPAAK